MEKTKSNLMTEGNIAKQILMFSIPLILGNLLQQLYSTADSIIVGNYVGSNALAAVGSSTSLIYLLIAFSQGASVGAGVVVSQYLGAKDKKGVNSAVHTAIAISIILGIVLTIGGMLLSIPILHWMNTPDEVFVDSSVYLKIYFGGVVFNVIYNMASGILNAAGNSKKSLFCLACASVTNIVLDILFIRVFNMGVAGAAIATDISQLVSSVLAIIYLVRAKADYHLELKKIRLDKDMVSLIVKIGLPTGIQNMVISFSNVLVQSGVNGYGASAMAGYGAYLKIDGFNILPVMSFSMAATTFVGQNYGAGKMDRVKKGMQTTLVMGLIYTIITGILLLTFSYSIMHLFTHDEEVIRQGQIAMRYFCPFYFIISILQGLAGTVRGTGKTVPPMVVLLISMCLFRIFWIKLILPYFFSSIEGIYILYPVSWTVGVILMLLYMRNGKWLTPKRISE